MAKLDASLGRSIAGGTAVPSASAIAREGPPLPRSAPSSAIAAAVGRSIARPTNGGSGEYQYDVRLQMLQARRLALHRGSRPIRTFEDGFAGPSNDAEAQARLGVVTDTLGAKGILQIYDQDESGTLGFSEFSQLVRDVVCCAAADVGRTVLEMRLVRTALRSLGLDRVSGEVAAAAFCEVTPLPRGHAQDRDFRLTRLLAGSLGRRRRIAHSGLGRVCLVGPP